jgi:hypothetical protein
MSNEMTTQEIRELTGVNKLQLHYLIYVKEVLKDYVTNPGSGRKRTFKPEAVEIIKAWMNKG